MCHVTVFDRERSLSHRLAVNAEVTTRPPEYVTSHHGIRRCDIGQVPYLPCVIRLSALGPGEWSWITKPGRRRADQRGLACGSARSPSRRNGGPADHSPLVVGNGLDSPRAWKGERSSQAHQPPLGSSINLERSRGETPISSAARASPITPSASALKQSRSSRLGSSFIGSMAPGS
jgi:hypothetical protein